MYSENNSIRRIEQNRRDYNIWDGRNNSFDPRIPVVTNIQVVSAGAAGLNTITVIWDDNNDPSIDEYEVFVREADYQPTRMTAVPKSPARFHFVSSGGAGSAVVLIRTVLRSGIKLSLDFAPSQVFSFV